MPKYRDYIAAKLADLTGADGWGITVAETNKTQFLSLAVLLAWIKTGLGGSAQKEVGFTSDTVLAGDNVSSRNGLRWFEDFVSSTQGTAFRDNGRYTGSGTDISVANAFSGPNPDDALGIVGQSVSSGGDGTCAVIYTDDCWFLGQGPITMEARIRLEQLWSSDNPFVYRFGFGNNYLEARPQTSMGWFEYDGSISPNWLCCTAKGGTVTVQNSGVPAATSYKRLRIEAASNSTNVVFKIGDAAVATITTNIPDGNFYGRTKLALCITSKGGSSYRLALCDYVSAKWMRATSR